MAEINPYEVSRASLVRHPPFSAGSIGFRIGLLFAAPVLALAVGSSLSFFRQREWEMMVRGFLLVVPSAVLVLCGYWWATSGFEQKGWKKLKAAFFQSLLICGIFLGSTAYLGNGIRGFRRVHLGTEDFGPACILFVLVAIYCWLLGASAQWSLRRNGASRAT